MKKLFGSIEGRLVACLATVLLLFAAGSGTTIFKLYSDTSRFESLNRDAAATARDRVPLLVALTRIRTNVGKVRQMALESIALHHTNEHVQKRAEAAEFANTIWADTEVARRHAENLGLTQVVEGIDAIEMIFPLFYDASVEIADAYTGERRHDVDAETMRGFTLFGRTLGGSLDELPAVVEQLTQQRLSESADRAANTNRNNTVLLRAIVVIAVVGGFLALVGSAYLLRLMAMQHRLLQTERDRAKIATRAAKSAHKEAEQANKAKSEFLANMSHEIRTPMNGVLGMAELLQQTELKDRQRKFVGTLRNSAENLLTVINDILDLSRIESGKFELDHADFDLRDTVDAVIDLLAESASSKDLELIYHIADDIPAWVKGDAPRLRQILLNLVSNAIKFTDKGEVVLRVSRDARSMGGTLINFHVTDTGIGMDEKTKERVFQAFHQADGSITRRFGGTGLGLAISKQLVELMGGKIGAESLPGRGSIFWFTANLSPAAVKSAPPKGTTRDLTGLRILVVDDNETNRDILRDVVESWGGTTEGLADGPAALQALSAVGNDGVEPFDLAIIDMMMPGMCGIELARAIKSDPQIADFPLIMLTSINWEGDREEARTVGIAGFLNKPVHQSELFDQVASVIARQPAEENGKPGRSRLDDDLSNLTQQSAQFTARVLVAEDNAVNQEVAREYLSQLGCNVDVVENGADAVEAIEEGCYDLILMDLQMPVMDGLKATEYIRSWEQLEKRPSTPIVALTANAFEADRENCLAAGMNDYMSKPFDLEQLGKMLGRWLQPGSTNDAQAHGPTDDPKTLHGVLDQSHLQSMRARQRPGRPNLLQRIITVYMETAPGQVAELRAAIDKQDIEAAGNIAHSLKSSSANVGAIGLSDLCQQLEGTARSSLSEELQPIFDDLFVEFNLVEAALKEEISSPLARTA